MIRSPIGREMRTRSLFAGRYLLAFRKKSSNPGLLLERLPVGARRTGLISLVTGGRRTDGRETGGRVTDGRLTGIRELPAARIDRVVVGRLTAEGRTIAGRLGTTVRVGRVCDAVRRVATGCRLPAERVVTAARLRLLRVAGRRLLALSARVNVGL